MTDDTPMPANNPKQPEVSQEDREAAASGYFAWVSGNPTIPSKMELGLIDDHGMVQAFARHRIAAERATRAKVLEEAANLCGTLAETTYDDADGFVAATGCEAAIRAMKEEPKV